MDKKSKKNVKKIIYNNLFEKLDMDKKSMKI